jgi:hypothetical protein
MKNEIIIRDFIVTPLTAYNACDDLKIQRLKKSENLSELLEIIEEFIELKIKQGYKIEYEV